MQCQRKEDTFIYSLREYKKKQLHGRFHIEQKQTNRITLENKVHEGLEDIKKHCSAALYNRKQW